MIVCYNKEAVGDTLLFILDNPKEENVQIDKKEAAVRIFTEEFKRTVSWNIFNASQLVGEINGNGQIKLSDKQLEKINEYLGKQGFSETIPMDTEPKIVTGYVKSCEPHPDSDHLSITQTEVGKGETLQIVCGAPNIEAGLKVVVAKPGAMMPDGMMIWPGTLRGVESYGMICSARELHLPNAPAKRGILELPDDTEVGKAFL
ncbi:YtpR family tRNA-binding protein [Vagococcus humatus]|uniref:DUF4479 domain-containing protein n=1 Tax=Vagococcus humatus TaxID=1889241 RepID=A0A3S0AFE8_9ENTE|nr:DUF4479 and tRNA-binding domain-containing protein [Vagococcus humatus]RST90333.1 DUF4479 domain-containing protein [Vagococcus humatus]